MGKENVVQLLDKEYVRQLEADIHKLRMDYILLNTENVLLKEKLSKYKAIENSNPSEALKNLKYLKNLTKVKDVLNVPYWNESYEIVETTLLKAQEQEKKLDSYKELEKKWGCSFEIIDKLINQNELYYQFYGELQHWTSIKVDLRKKVVWYCKQVGGHYACSQPLSNYGKTFWLKKDKSE